MRPRKQIVIKRLPGLALSHERWGYVKEIGSPRSCSWHEMSIPVEDPRVLIFDPRVRIERTGYRDDVVGVPFQYRVA